MVENEDHKRIQYTGKTGILYFSQTIQTDHIIIKIDTLYVNLVSFRAEFPGIFFKYKFTNN